MKKWLSSLLALCIALSLAACGSGEPAETTQLPTSAVTQPTTEAIQPATEATEPVAVYVPYELSEGESYEKKVRSLGFEEFYSRVYAWNQSLGHGRTDVYVTPTSLDISDTGFRMTLDCGEYVPHKQGLQETSDWVLYGAKGDGCRNISELNMKEFSNSRRLTMSETRYTEAELQIMQEDCHRQNTAMSSLYYRTSEVGAVLECYYWAGIYFPDTGNLYNFVRKVDKKTDYDTAPAYPRVFMLGISSFSPEMETIQYGDEKVELGEFMLCCGSEFQIYQYRPGMSFSDWACSELNTDGWIPWYDDTVLSPDGKYTFSTENNPISSGGHNSLAPGDGKPVSTRAGVIIANEFDGELDHNHDHKDEEGNVTQDPSVEAEIARNGNINVPVAHMVNAKTPLFTPGFRIVGREGGRLGYHSVEIGEHYLQDDILDIYMNQIPDSWISHIKLYAFQESQAFMDMLGGQLILDAHPTPLDKDDEMLTIPEDAMCLTFRRVSGAHAPNSPNRRAKANTTKNQNAVYARYVTMDDPNFDPEGNLVFAITYDDELVYWIHMGSNFNASNNGAVDLSEPMPD